MILAQALSILRAKWQLAAALSLLCTVLLIATYTPSLPTHSTVVQFIVGQAPLDSRLQNDNDEERYFGWVTSEYVAIALRDWGNGSALLSDIRWRLWVDGYRFELAELDELTRWSVDSNTVQLTIQHVDTEVIRRIASAATDAFIAFDSTLLPHLQLAKAEIRRIDGLIMIEEARPTVRRQVELPLRLIAGLSIGPLVALWLGLRNDKIIGRSAVEALNLTVIGEIPSL